MRSTLLKLADDVRGSYWFLPSIMVIAALGLAGGMIFVDTHAGADWMDGLPWLYAARPNGARQVLSVISGSMITVAGTVFSVTIAAVVYASGQYGPRLLSNFMGDRGNQVTLGTFIATFVYCLLILRTIRSEDEAGAGDGFVPNLALLVGVGLVLCSIAVLIYFIHHVPRQLHINRVVEDIGDRLLADIDRRFPKRIGAPADDQASQPDAPSNPVLVPASSTGYLQVVEEEALMAFAREHDLVLRLRRQPGDFVQAGRPIVEAWPPERCPESAAAGLGQAFAVGSRRTALQDLRFLIDELVEIAGRALSPGVNDPFTALTCLDWLGAALSELAERDLPSPLRLDQDGVLRIVAPPETFEGFMARGFGALAQYCASDMVAALGFIRALGAVCLRCDDPERLRIVGGYGEDLAGIARSKLTGFNLERVIERQARLAAALVKPDHRRHLLQEIDA